MLPRTAPANLFSPADPDAKDSIGARIRLLRHRRGMTQTELAAAMGVSRSLVALWETNRSRDAHTLPKLAEAAAERSDRVPRGRVGPLQAGTRHPGPTRSRRPARSWRGRNETPAARPATAQGASKPSPQRRAGSWRTSCPKGPSGAEPTRPTGTSRSARRYPKRSRRFRRSLEHHRIRCSHLTGKDARWNNPPDHGR